MSSRGKTHRGSRSLAAALALVLLAAACSVRPVADPGLGDADLTTRVLAADGTLIAEWHRGEIRIPVTFDQLPRHLVDAVVAAEDRRFWEHPGVDLAAVARAAAANVEAGDVVQGGSTITQQYVKNVLLSPDVDLARKAEEAVLAIGLEETLSKEEILERYLNTVYLGSNAYGVGAAAQRYFGVAVEDLDLAQAATLAGIIPAPSTTNPLADPSAALTRRNLVLDAMLEEESIDAGTHADAVAQPLDVIARATVNRYPYFAEELKRRLLADPRLGDMVDERSDLLFGGGLTITTTLDIGHQDAAEDAIADVMAGRAPEAALLAIEPATGRVLALVGGRDFWSGAPGSQFDLATQGRRQPGSTMKPFVLAAAIEKGWSLDDKITGRARVVIPTADGPWEVDNYQAMAFPDLTLADATAYSVNTAYASLIDRVGAAAVVDVLDRTGVGALAGSPTLALGTEEVSLLDLTTGYATLANHGTLPDVHLVTSVTLADGTVLFSEELETRPALDPGVADEVTAALTGVVSRGTGTQARIGRPAAGKTGTTQGSTDAWFVGFTPEVAAGVWIGFPNSTKPLVYPATPFAITGGSWPAIIWSRYAITALAGTPLSDLPSVEAALSVRIDPATGTVIGDCSSGGVTVALTGTTDDPVACDDASRMPSLLGLPAADAVALVAQLGVPFTVVWRGDVDPELGGSVVGNEPAAGELVESESVTLMIAGSPAALPALTGLSVETAREQIRLQPRHLTVVVAASGDGHPSGTIWRQSPLAGDEDAVFVKVWVEP